MLQIFVQLWRSENSLNEVGESPVDLIVPICYAMSGPNRLGVATRLNFEKALQFLTVFPKASLAFGNCSYIFPGSEKVESELKRKMFPALSYMDVVEVTLRNSVEEAENVRTVMGDKGIEPRCILVVTGELHSRSARFIWQRVFPYATILIHCIACSNEVEMDHLIRVQRTIPRWICANLARHFLLRTVGLSIRNLHHRIAK